MLSAKKEGHVPSSKSVGKKALEELKKIAVPLATKEWIDSHDELLDQRPEYQITVDDLFSKQLIHKTYSHESLDPTPFDWSEFRQALEMRNANSPRWFVQLREEDLLLGPHGLDGVRVDCFVVVEAKAPTFSPAEYIVKVHWPYSDAEDNAPERILSIAQQGMCWRRVVKNNGGDINVYLLQKRDSVISAAPDISTGASFGFGPSSSAPTTNSGSSSSPSVGFSFGATSFFSTTTPSATTGKQPSSDIQPGGFSFGFGAAPTSSAVPSQLPGLSFGFSSTSSKETKSADFGFGSAPSSPPSSSPSSFISSFSFGTGTSGGASTLTERDTAEVPMKNLSTSEILFCLWSKNRLEDMKKEILSGSRIVREGFRLSPTMTLKLVMQNEVEDDVHETAYRLILTNVFAKANREVGKINQWINDCPVYDENLADALQEFRENQLKELAEESAEFNKMVKEFQPRIEEELHRIIQIRRKAAQLELDMIEFILERMKRKLLLEKSEFRLLKYYAKNDTLPFRPFGKISGISEMGETVDVCVPPAHVNVNPFTGK